MGPVVENLAQQILAVFEVPVEAALGDSQGPGQSLHGDAVDAVAGQGLEARRQPLLPGYPASLAFRFHDGII